MSDNQISTCKLDLALYGVGGGASTGCILLLTAHFQAIDKSHPPGLKLYLEPLNAAVPTIRFQ